MWFGSACRSVMPLCRSLGEMDGVRVTVVLTEAVAETRKQLGWGADSAGKAELIVLDEADRTAHAERLLAEHKDAVHVVGAYQRASVQRHVALQATARRMRLYIISEAPLNMESGWRHHAKKLYMRCVLPGKARPVIEGASGIFCMSGLRFEPLQQIGWPIEKVLPFGYFTADRGLRASMDRDPGGRLRIICLGFLRRYKAVDHLLYALAELQRAGIDFTCDITGDGPDAPRLRQIHRSLGLGETTRLHGIVDEPTLERIVTDADVIACPGLVEPWAIRVNESIQANVPMVISDRIGAADLVQASGAGLVFRSGDIGELAAHLRTMADSPELVMKMKQAGAAFRPRIEPAVAAEHLVAAIHAVDAGHVPPVAPWRLPLSVDAGV